ncbi:DUF3293 domain-containing protein [Castellaniella sp. MT123]|uniref:DUF3293 domain-containing protein n=1 Tax=Castellaniella sp. MT123 TaxID=3140381 RepID=UPI0031F40CD7
MTPLVQAYRDALYRIDAAPTLTLRIGWADPDLEMLHRRHSCACSVFLTACNPRSRRLRPAANARRMRALQRTLSREGRAWLPGRSIDPLGLWPDEPSAWIPGLPLPEALNLARRFGQNALVWCAADGIARLIWVRRGPAGPAGLNGT